MARFTLSFDLEYEWYGVVWAQRLLLTCWFICFQTGMPGFEEFVCTNCADCVTDSSPLFGIDCEMVRD